MSHGTRIIADLHSKLLNLSFATQTKLKQIFRFCIDLVSALQIRKQPIDVHPAMICVSVFLKIVSRKEKNNEAFALF